MCATQVRTTNERGFLSDPKQWSPVVADALAQAEGVKLTGTHWRVLNAIRDFFEENGIPPTYHVLRHEVEEAVDPFKYNCVLSIEYLFPHGGIKQACRIAGLPNYYCFGC